MGRVVNTISCLLTAAPPRRPLACRRFTRRPIARRRHTAAVYCCAPPPHRGGAPRYLFHRDGERGGVLWLRTSPAGGVRMSKPVFWPQKTPPHSPRLVRLRIKNIPCPIWARYVFVECRFIRRPHLHQTRRTGAGESLAPRLLATRYYYRTRTGDAPEKTASRNCAASS